ncbi:hypothetical protein T06_12318 [Trichinella sp. T6]|nr:hypothetical protein T06_12318 [Trichinella sp. T6]
METLVAIYSTRTGLYAPTFENRKNSKGYSLAFFEKSKNLNSCKNDTNRSEKIR